MALTPVRIAAFQQARAIVDKEGRPTAEFLRALNSAFSQLQNAQNETNAALVAAGLAQTAATQGLRELARINSYTDPTDVLTAADTGTDATITIASHLRVYPVQGAYDVPDVPITGAAVAGLLFSTIYYVYYDDTTLADTTPAFLTTTDAPTAQVGAAAGRHFVGVITTPADGGGGTSGDGGFPPGGGGGPLP